MDGAPWISAFTTSRSTGLKPSRKARMGRRGTASSMNSPARIMCPRFIYARCRRSPSTRFLLKFHGRTIVFQTNISSGIPGRGGGANGISTTTPKGQFHIQEKMPSKHMGNGNLFAGADDYELPGVPWTCFFTDAGHAFHGTYWHENFGTPMSHGCVNMRTSEAKWLFRWALPPHKVDALYNRGYGTTVDIHY